MNDISNTNNSERHFILKHLDNIAIFFTVRIRYIDDVYMPMTLKGVSKETIGILINLRNRKLAKHSNSSPTPMAMPSTFR